MVMSPFEILCAIGAAVGFWARVEHRLTRLEEKIKNVSCPNCGEVKIK